jgi:hypothetical protein
MSLNSNWLWTVRPPNERESPVAVVWFVDNRTMNLEPIEPETTVELYLENKKLEAQSSTVRSHRLRLDHFIRGATSVTLSTATNSRGDSFTSTASGGATIGN